MLESEQLLIQLQTTINSLVETTRGLSNSLQGDIKDLYQKIADIREAVATLEADERADKGVTKKLELAIGELKGAIDKLSLLTLSEEEVSSIRASVLAANRYIAKQEGRAAEKERGEVSSYRTGMLKMVGAAVAGGGGTAALVELIRVLTSSGGV